MAGPRPLGPLIHSFFADHLITVKGLRPASVRSYRDTIRLLLCFAASDKHTKITRLSVEDLTFDRVLGFLRYLEHDRGNHARTRNQRLAALHTLFGYIASREPQMLGTCQQVAAIPAKRAAPAQTRFLERDEVEALFRSLPRKGRLALRDRALLLFLYNTGARVQETADLRAGHLDLGEYPVARLHGKGGTVRTVLLDDRGYVALLRLYLARAGYTSGPLFRASINGRGGPLSYDAAHSRWKKYCAAAGTGIGIHQLRHAHASELINSGVSIEVVRRRLGHASAETTQVYTLLADKVADTEIRAARRRRETSRR